MPILTNTVTNPDFATDGNSDGIADGWVAGSATTGFSISNNAQFFTGGGGLVVTGNNWFYQQSAMTTQGSSDIFYIRLSIRNESGANLFQLGSGYYAAITDTMTTSYVAWSARFAQNVSADNSTQFVVAFNTGVAGSIKEALVVNLTSGYGSGSEPAIGVCDAWDWWEGEWNTEGGIVLSTSQVGSDIVLTWT